jgi:hypothetical protein
VADGAEELSVRAFPDQRVGHDDGGGEGDGPPVGGQVDDRGRQMVVEQDIAAEIPVDELAGGRERARRGGQSRQVIHLSEVISGDLAPGDAVAGGPGAVTLIQESGPGDPAQSCVELLADRDHLWPAALGVLARQVLGCAPAIDAG